MTTHYEALGVAEDATEEQIKKAFRQIAFECHPDKTNDDGARKRMTAASTAYSVLRSSESRAEYDKRLEGVRRRRAKKAEASIKPCVQCGGGAFPGSSKCWSCLLGEAMVDHSRRQQQAERLSREAERAAREAERSAREAARAAAAGQHQRSLDEQARARAEAARRLRAELERQALLREVDLNEQEKHASTHGYADPIHAPDAEALFQAILSESALKAARGVRDNGVDLFVHIAPKVRVEPRGDTAELAREVHRGLKQANRLLDRVRKWFLG